MAITISGQNNNDRILASDGVLDSISGFNVVGVMTAAQFDVTGKTTIGHLNIGSDIQIGNAGIITATTLIGNVTGNINHTSNLLLQISGSEKFRVGTSGQLGIGGANYGTSGQVLTSGGSGSAATWSTIASDAITEGNTNAEVVDTGSDGHFKVTTEGTERLRITSTGSVGIGEDAPVAKVHIAGSNYVSVGGGGFDSNVVLAITRNFATGHSAGLALNSGTNATSFIHLGDADDPDIGKITYDHANNFMSFTSNANERLRITSDGKIGIGTASPTFAAGGGVHLQGGNEFTSYKVSAHTNTGVDFAQDAAGVAYVYNRDNADLILGTNNSQRVRINNSGAIGLGGANYGSSGQVLTSQGSGSAVTWSTISGTTINNNADNRIITGSGTANTLNGEANITYDATTSLLKLATASSTSTDAVLLHLVGGGTSDRGLKISTGRASGAGQNHAAAIYDAINSESSGYGSQHRFKIAGTDCFTIGYNGDFGFVGINDNVPYPDSIGGSTVNTCLELGSPSGTDTASVIKFNGRDGSSNLNKCQIQWSGAHNRFDITVNGNQALQIQPNKDVEVTDGDLVIGTAGHGISFAATSDSGGGTMSSEVLDDYEEGLWVPLIRNTSGSGTYGSSNVGSYTKIGNMVYISGTIHWTAMSGTTNWAGVIRNLPFASYSGTGYYRSACVVGATSGLTPNNSGDPNIVFIMDRAQGFLYIVGTNTTSGGFTHYPTISNAGSVYGFDLSYRVS